MAEPLLVALAAGCTLATVDTRVEVDAGVVIEQVRAEVTSDGTCQRVSVVLPPGVTLTRSDARSRLSDDTRRKLDPARWESVGRDATGVAYAVLHVPELLRGDGVRLDLERRWTGRDYRWAPGRDGARWAEIRLPFDVATLITGALEGSGRSRWVATPGPDDGIAIPHDSRRTDSIFVSDSATPAEAVARVSTWALLPTRPDLDLGIGDPAAAQVATAADVAHALVAWTADGPTPLTLGYVLPNGAPAFPGQALTPIAATRDAEVARLWAHPDQDWPPGARVLIDGAVMDVVAAPAGAGPRAAAPALLDRTVELQLPAGADPRVALVPGRGSRTVQTDVWRLPDPERARVRAWAVPAGARVVNLQVVDGPHSIAALDLTRDQVWLVAAAGESPHFTVVTEIPDAPACGERPTVDGATLTRFEVRADGADVRDEGGWWWVHEWDGAPLLSERARVVAGLHGRFNRRSIPEPGLPLRLRSRLDGWGLAAEMPAALRARAIVAPLPADPRWPRPLMKARRSGVVTPIEAALIVRAYALQSKLEADWALVRPADRGPGHALCPIGYDEGLVRIIHEGDTHWLDPACTACAPFEVRPELLGASAMGPWVDGTPDPPRGRSEITVNDDATVTWGLHGPAALELRRWLATVPTAEREATMAERLGGRGATLLSATGVAEAGQDITVVVQAVSPDAIPEPRELLLPATRPDGSLFVSWPGLRRYTWDLDGMPVVVQADVVQRVVPSAGVASLATQLQRPYVSDESDAEVDDDPGEPE